MNTPLHDARDNGTRPSSATLDELLTVAEVAALLKVTPSWVYEHTRSRGGRPSERLPHVKIGKFDARVLRAFLEKKCRVA